ncbi:hypothetical protein ATI61_107373 [Archangium gephyra]|uniref:Uncharacterized protein n=1 Tax=Archangium gephyra TaxID=48 RepID=A0AAC8QI47_9BACT|nr:hypothetical protein [Archangium gephyra]AKJ07930.1 Hypothetical protein AA314_09556 [Archangium gephyra]REG29677.1 hypothetical protein ATI61_107373 [Archangium gephyra]
MKIKTAIRGGLSLTTTIRTGPIIGRGCGGGGVFPVLLKKTTVVE